MPPRRIYEHSGPAELVLEGENLTPETLKLYHNGVLYTPLESSDTYAYYLLGDNGTNKVMLNGKNFCTIVVKDIEVPEWLPTMFTMAQSNQNNISLEGVANRVNVENANCINYPYRKNDEYPHFLLRVQLNDVSVEESDFVMTNATKVTYSRTGNFVYILMDVVNTQKPSYLTYQGLIIAVFNYAN